jgi:hypothetical protein
MLTPLVCVCCHHYALLLPLLLYYLQDVLFQLQVLFAFLRISQRQYHDTKPFCSAFRDYDGQPISLTEQVDYCNNYHSDCSLVALQVQDPCR